MATCPACKGEFEASYCPRDGTRLIEGELPVIGDRYRLLRKVGEGAMGEVYEAEHVLLHRKVAVKLLQRRIAADPEASTRLQREARSTSGLAHPNVVDTLDFGFAGGQAFLVMEWLDGENLDDLVARGPLEIATALDIAAQTCAGVAAAHDRGVIHRDLKPANLFLTRDHRGELLVKVLDFGIAKIALHETKLTATGVLMGTPNYMAPEQAEGQPIDARTDIYALGVILYEMLTGTVPFVGETPLAVLHQHTSRLPILPSARAPGRGISEALDTVVMRCLSKRPDERFSTMHELAAALAEMRGTASPASPAPSASPAPPSGHGTAAAVATRAFDVAAARTHAARARTRDDDRDRDLDLDSAAAADAAGGRRRWILPVVVGAFAIAAAAVTVIALRGSRPPGALPASAARAVAHVDAAVVVAGTAAPAADAAALVVPDAPTADAAMASPGATFAIAGRRFAGTLVARPAIPIAGQRVELTVEIGTLDAGLQEAAAEGRLTATIELRYFKDHSLVEESTHRLDASGRFTVTPRLAHSAKHHAHVDLLVDGKEVDHAKVDLFPDLR